LHGIGQGLVLDYLLFYVFLGDLKKSILQTIELYIDLEFRKVALDFFYQFTHMVNQRNRNEINHLFVS